MARPSESAGSSGRKRERPDPGGASKFEPVGRRPEEASDAHELGLGGEGSWAPEQSLADVQRVSDDRPAIDPDRAMPGLAPRRSSAPPVPRVGQRATEGRLVGERACLGCGYNLRGAQLDGRCPECGHPIGDAAAPRDGPLSLAPPPIVRQVAIGCGLVAIAGVLAWAGSLLGLVGAAPGEFVAWVLFVAAGVWVAGLLPLTGAFPDPLARFNGMTERDGWRVAARWASPKVLLFAIVALIPWILSRVPAPAGAPAGVASAATPATLDLVATVTTILLLPFLISLGLGLVIVRRMAVWARDGLADRAIQAAQWTIPIGCLALLAAGAGWPSSYRGSGQWWTLTLFLVVHAPLAGALASLAASTLLCVQHGREGRERAVRRADRRDAYANRVADRVDRVSGG